MADVNSGCCGDGKRQGVQVLCLPFRHKIAGACEGCVCALVLREGLQGDPG